MINIALLLTNSNDLLLSALSVYYDVFPEFLFLEIYHYNG